MKRFLGIFLAVVMLFSLSTTAFAAVNDTGFSDVAADAWYADAVEYVRDNGLMSGTSATTFAPNDTMTRAMLAMVLYRLAGSPAVSGQDSFTDTVEGSWYSSAILWSYQKGLISGYGGGLFGTNDPVTREQIATILWRYDGSPDAESGNNFADESAIASYAMDAVDWVRASGIMNGKGGNIFDPKGNATRAEVATILRNYTQLEQEIPSEPDPEPVSGGKVLVAYFSATNTTEGVAEVIADTLNADLFELEPVDPYTSSDLNYGNDSSRVVYEHEHPEAQDIELVAETVDNWDEYDTVFIGYPIWWHAAAWPVNRFVTENDFTGKTVVPFCTSASSGLEGSDVKLRDMAGTGNWLPGRNFFGRDSDSVIADWVNSLDLPTAAATPSPVPTPEPAASNALVAYFSVPETTNPNNMTTEEANSTVVINGEVLGNTQYMAYVIQEATGADIFRIEPETPYPTDHSVLVPLALEEQNNNARPAIQDTVDNMDDYDVIYLGYPNWWGDMPMILYSFLEEYDLSGKTIVPFNTHGGSGFSSTISTIARIQPDATVIRNGLSISRDRIQDAEQDIIDWVNDLGL